MDKHGVADYTAELESSRHSTAALGFWIYLMTDTLLFGSLFATFAVLRNATYGGPSMAELADMPLVLIETFLLLSSSFTAGLALLNIRSGRTKAVLVCLAVTALLGLGFLAIELSEFRSIIAEGYSWKTSAFLTAFFALVGTHGAHITVGLIWIASMIYRIAKRGLTKHEVRRMTLFSLYWHFLDLIWIFIFSVVYLMGVAG